MFEELQWQGISLLFAKEKSIHILTPQQENTHTASAVPARIHRVSEKYLCAPFPLAPNVPAPAPSPLLDAFKHKYLGLAQVRNAPIDASAEATARTVRCILLIASGNNVQWIATFFLVRDDAYDPYH